MLPFFRGVRSCKLGTIFEKRDTSRWAPSKESASLAALAGAWTHIWDEFGEDGDSHRETKFLNTWIGVTHPEGALEESAMPDGSILDGVTGDKHDLAKRKANGPWTGVPCRLRKQAFEEGSGLAAIEWDARLKAAVRMGILTEDVAQSVSIYAESERWIILKYIQDGGQRYLVFIRGSANNTELMMNMPWNATKEVAAMSEAPALTPGMIKQTRHGVVHGGFYVTVKELLEHTYSWHGDARSRKAHATATRNMSFKQCIIAILRKVAECPTTSVVYAGHSKGAAEAWLICASMCKPMALPHVRAPMATRRGNDHPLDAETPFSYWDVDGLPRARADGQISFIGLGLPPTYFRLGNSKVIQYCRPATHHLDIEIVNGADVISSNTLTKGSFHRHPRMRTRVYEYDKNIMVGDDECTRTRGCFDETNVLRKDYSVWLLRTFQTNSNEHINWDDHKIFNYVLAMAKAEMSKTDDDISDEKSIASIESAAWHLWESCSV